MKPHAQPGGVDPAPVGQPRIAAGHRELQEAYAQQRGIVHALGASSPDFIYIFDRAQRFMYVSPPLLRLWGRTQEEAVGKTFEELGYDPALVALHTRQLDEALTGKTISGSNAYVSPAGVEGQYEYTFVPVVGADGQVVSVVGTTRDVTARLRAEGERAEAAERAAVEEKKLAREREAVRAALHETEELVRLSPVPMVLFRGPDHVYALVNAAHDRMLRKRVVGKAIREAHTKEEAGQAPEILDRVYRTGEPFVTKANHYSVQGEDGRARSIWVHEWFYPMRDMAGDVVGVLGVAQDVTDEVRARGEVSTVLNAIPAFVTRVNTEGRFVFVSQSNAKYFGPTEKILGRTMKEYHGADYDFFADKVDAALRGEQVEFEWASPPLGDGLVHHFIVNYSPERGPDGAVEGFVTCIFNIDALKEAETHLKAASVEADLQRNERAQLLERAQAARLDAGRAEVVRSAQIEALLNAAPLGVYLVDSALRVRQANPTATAVFGLPDLIGRDFGEVIRSVWPKEMADEVLQRFRHTLETGESYVEPYRSDQRLDRGVRECYEWQLDPIPLPEGRGVVCYFREISAHVRAREALADSDRRKDKFLAMLAHELRNPLAPISTAIQLLRLRVGDNASLGKPLDVLSRQTGQLTKLVDDLLDVSRITNGNIRLEKVPLEARAAIVLAVESSRPLIDARKHDLSITFPHAALWVSADSTRLNQILSNLLNNAAKYTDEGGRIQIAAERDGPDAVFRVQDNGVGFTEELKPYLFDLFTQADTSLDRSQGGLGIGLAVVRGLVELQGGRVEAHSDGLGRGSEFVVRLPALPARALTEDLAAPAQARDESQCRIVVVDDNVDAALILAELLTATGHHVKTAHDGRSALEVVEAHRPNLVLLDIGLPGMDGYAVASLLRQAHGERMTLVALTGYGRDDDRQRSKAAGFDLHLVKPVALESLWPIITLALRPRSASTSSALSLTSRGPTFS